MMKILKCAYFLILIVGVINPTFSQKKVNYYNNFIDYSNKDKMGMRIDAEIIKDKDFKLRIPCKLKNELKSVDNAFSHFLEFNKDQKIVIIYFPFQLNDKTLDEYNLTYDKFEELCEQENLERKLEREKAHFKKNRYFGMKKIKNLSFYVLYLNVRQSELDKFNYSINSIEL